MALAFDKGPRFAIDKAAGVPCPNLARHHCSIHADLEDRGFPGCTAYDCTGAGQRVTQEVFSGKTWQDDPGFLLPMLESFRYMRVVQSNLELVSIAQKRLPDAQARSLRRLAAPLAVPLTADETRILATGPLPGQIRGALQSVKDRLLAPPGPLQPGSQKPKS